MAILAIETASLISRHFTTSSESYSEIDDAKLISPDTARYTPFADRTPLNCSGIQNGTGWDLCNPCGLTCPEGVCLNNFCAIGCADKDIEERLYTYYAVDSDDQKIDFKGGGVASCASTR